MILLCSARRFLYAFWHPTNPSPRPKNPVSPFPATHTKITPLSLFLRARRGAQKEKITLSALFFSIRPCDLADSPLSPFVATHPNFVPLSPFVATHPKNASVSPLVATHFLILTAPLPVAGVTTSLVPKWNAIPLFPLTSPPCYSSNFQWQLSRTLLSCCRPSLALGSRRCLPPRSACCRPSPLPTNPSPKLLQPSPNTRQRRKPAWMPISRPGTFSISSAILSRTANPSTSNSAAANSTWSRCTPRKTTTNFPSPADCSTTGWALRSFPAPHSHKPAQCSTTTPTTIKLISRKCASPSCSCRTATGAKCFCSFTVRPWSP